MLYYRVHAVAGMDKQERKKDLKRYSVRRRIILKIKIVWDGVDNAGMQKVTKKKRLWLRLTLTYRYNKRHIQTIPIKDSIISR